MRCSLLPRVVPTARQAFLGAPASHTFPLQHLPVLQVTQVALASTIKAHAIRRPDPLKQHVNPNIKNKIRPEKRPLARPFLGPPSKTPEELAAMPYIVRRTPYTGMPVYRRWMSGGNRIIVLIKKVDGNRGQLVDELEKSLGLDKADIRINPTTQHVEIKGDHYAKAIDWLVNAGF